MLYDKQCVAERKSIEPKSLRTSRDHQWEEPNANLGGQCIHQEHEGFLDIFNSISSILTLSHGGNDDLLY